MNNFRGTLLKPTPLNLFSKAYCQTALIKNTQTIRTHQHCHQNKSTTLPVNGNLGRKTSSGTKYQFSALSSPIMTLKNAIPTRVMVISDTHEHSFDGSTMPVVDVLIHTGDLTNFGELEILKESVKMMGTIEAELKMVIAGNHDISLDKNSRVENMSPEEYLKYHEAALEIMTGPAAKSADVTYLEEGTHTFTLSNSAKFTVYASPYTPGSGGWGFTYQRKEDRFNNPIQTAPNRVSIATNPIPSGVDIVMTHGPPYLILDQVDGQHSGCSNLLRAVGRVRPLMHCFGHIHEGHGANLVTWERDNSVKYPAAATPLETEQINDYPYANDWPITPGEQTLMVNAAIMRNTAKGMRPDYQPFIVTLNLPRR